MKQRMKMVLRCSTCKQAIGGAVRDAATNVDANLFGAMQYVVCPTCNQLVPENLRTPAYKSACTRKARAKAQDKTVAARIVAQWMYEQVKLRAVLWHAYALSAIRTRFGEELIKTTKEGDGTICDAVIHEFCLLSGKSIVWDKHLAQWRERL